MELYPWRFDSIHSHCHDDVILILNILKNLGYRAPPRRVQKKQGQARPRRVGIPALHTCLVKMRVWGTRFCKNEYSYISFQSTLTRHDIYSAGRPRMLLLL
jgi:hypothetical protein